MRPCFVVHLAAACVILLPGIAACSGRAIAATPETIPDAYAQAATLVTIAPGRRLNLRCTGQGSPTVLLEAGSHADSSSWFRVQPLLAAFTRVCAYDRAGYGFSDAGPLPRNLDADVADLHALFRRASIVGPVVLVGHSLGSNIARLYATRHPDAVTALVLVDPPAQDVAAFAPDWSREEAATNAQRFAFVRRCEAAAERHQLTRPPPGLEACIARADPLASARVNAATRAWKSRPAFWRTLLSELQSNVAVFDQPVTAAESHGTLPLLVLSADGTYADAPPQLRATLETARDHTHKRIVATSSRGRLVKVAHTSHDIQLDRPEAVVNAVKQAIRQSSSPRD